MLLTVGSFFSGICAEKWALDGLHIPHKHVFACEFDKFAAQFIAQNIDTNVIVEDLRTVDVSTLPRVHLFLSSPPCQGFSSLGRRQASDLRKDLWRRSLAYAAARKPRVFVLENVPAFQKSKGFHELIAALQQIYRFVGHTVLNSAGFGSVQSRKRLFVVAQNRTFAFPTPQKHGTPPPLSVVLDDPRTAFRYLTEKQKAYLESRARWGVKIYGRRYRGHVGTLCKSYGHSWVTWKHIVEETNGRLRNITPSEAFELMGYRYNGFEFKSLSNRRRYYLAGNTISKEVLTSLFQGLAIRTVL